MKVLLKKPATVRLNAGEIVEVSPAQAKNLIEFGLAEIVTDRETPERKKTRKK